MTALAVATFEAERAFALELGGRALSFVERTRRPLLASAVFDAEVLVIGALQREQTLASRSPARLDAIARRLTTGTEAQLTGRTAYHALALPSVAALFPDASARTLLNRNLRLLLRGYTAAGVPLRYFGTEVLALLGHPVALVGYERAESGAFLIEVFVGLDEPCVVRSALKREPPAALFPLLRAAPDPGDLIRRMAAGAVERHGVSADDVSEALVEEAPRCAAGPRPAQPSSVVEIPLGVVEAGGTPLSVTGDLLVSTHALEAFAGAATAAHSAHLPIEEALGTLQGQPLDGARPADLVEVVSRAFAR